MPLTRVGDYAAEHNAQEWRTRPRQTGCFYGAKTIVTGGIDRPRQFVDPTVRIRVARNGRTLDVLGPHDRCVRSHGSGGFNPFEYSFKVKVKGRFVSKDTAKGSLSWQMTVDGTRNEAGPSPCPPLRTKFTAKRGKVVGLKAAKMPSRTKWHPEGQVP
jgi:hypothetical protein